ncbi:hypothetical protein M422DRAFT_782393 [Sphaerobolus stellatus SS14]|uniref:Uncharacterized protein n=1 Tax=Sphaerobolus stellatus (strain SS14) TaxID=990650 RepID=A0A0C9V2L4_SPHS4|nr:hypothetical protein M422DRAFT_782393 [Sphaerobolus stellatus SS14]
MAQTSPVFSALTGNFKGQALLALEGPFGSVSNVINALGNQARVLKPAFASRAISAINSLMSSGVGIAQDFANNVAPSLSWLSFQTQTENAASSALSKYQS